MFPTPNPTKKKKDGKESIIIWHIIGWENSPPPPLDDYITLAVNLLWAINDPAMISTLKR